MQRHRATGGTSVLLRVGFVARASLMLALCLLPVASHAVWQWMRGAALTDFKDSDWAMLKETAARVLNDEPDHKQVNWSNPDTGNRGAIIALATFQYDGRKCRRAAMRNTTAHGRQDQSTYTLCQQPDGTWAFVPESAIESSAKAPPSADAGARP